MKNISNKEFNISENTIDILDGIKVTELQTNGYYYSLIKTSVLSNIVSDLEEMYSIARIEGETYVSIFIDLIKRDRKKRGVMQRLRKIII